MEDTKVVIRIRTSKNRQHNGQKFEDTKGVNRIRISKKDRQHNGQKFEDTKGVIRIRTSTKDLQHNVQKFEDTKGSKSESVNRRRIDNTMAKRTSMKEQTTINNTYIFI
jgi:uncharacterized protein involved in type VI secretion and phage assembly